MAIGTAALIKDLKQRGMLEDTVILWTTEFGRMPSTQGSKGRDHNPHVFTNWLAGGGVRGGGARGRQRRERLRLDHARLQQHVLVLHRALHARPRAQPAGAGHRRRGRAAPPVRRPRRLEPPS